MNYGMAFAAVLVPIIVLSTVGIGTWKFMDWHEIYMNKRGGKK